MRARDDQVIQHRRPRAVTWRTQYQGPAGLQRLFEPQLDVGGGILVLGHGVLLGIRDGFSYGPFEILRKT